MLGRRLRAFDEVMGTSGALPVFMEIGPVRPYRPDHAEWIMVTGDWLAGRWHRPYVGRTAPLRPTVRRRARCDLAWQASTTTTGRVVP